MAYRKTSKDYKKEYQELQEKKVALESRIRNRLKEMCKNCPDAVIGRKANSHEPVLAKDYPEKMIKVMDIGTALAFINRIEQHNEKKFSYVQKSMFDEKETE